MRGMILGAAALAAMTLLAAPASAQLSMSTIGSPVTEDFASFAGAGFAPSPAAGQLDSDAWVVTGLSDGPMTFGDTRTTGDFARGASTGGVSTGGVYAFDIGSGRISLGVQPTGSDFTPGTILLRARNDTMSTLTSVDVSFVGAAYNDGDRSSTVTTSYSTDGMAFTSLTPPFTTPAAADPSPSWLSLPFAGTAGPISVPPGGFFFLRVEAADAGGSGSRDELALVTISLTPMASGGACSTDADCDDMNPCTADSCLAGACSYGPVPPIPPVSCDDGDPCTTGDICDPAGICIGGPPACDDANACTADRCDPATGACSHVAAPAGTSCSDFDLCNGDEICDGSGTCQMGTPLVCADMNPCTADICDPMVGCFFPPEPPGTNCSDSNVCNGMETCSGSGTCGGGTPLVCDDMNPCTADSCDPTSGCANTPVAAGTSCADGDACNGDETCDGSGACQMGMALDCDDMNPCTADSCDAASGCANDPVAAGMPCADGDLCNGDETCDGAGACQMGTALDCDDGDDCTTDTCDATMGCQNDPIPMCTGDDAGVMTDGGAPMTDGGAPMTDGGASMSDGGATGSDAGPPDGSEDGGCSCRASRPSGAAPWWLASLAGALLWSRRRRRR